MLLNRIRWIKRRRIRRPSLLWFLRAQHQRRIINQVLLTSQYTSDRKSTKSSWNRAESLMLLVTANKRLGTKAKTSLWSSMMISKLQSLAARNLIIMMRCKNSRFRLRNITNRNSKTWRIDMREWHHMKRSSRFFRNLMMHRILVKLQREVVQGPNGHE